MNRIMQSIFIGLAIILLSGLTPTGATSDMQQKTETASRQESPVTRPFKLRAAGQIDLATGGIGFGGVASHLGLYSANGFLDPSDFSISGTIEAANGDQLDFVGSFTIGPLGEIEANFIFAGGTGRFEDAAGSATGPVMLDPDFTFLLTVIGDLDY